MYNLKANAFKLWIYFVDNKNEYKLELYPVDFTNKANVARSTYYDAFKELEEKGYLIRSKKQRNLYLFKEKSKNTDNFDLINSVNKESFSKIKQDYF